MKKWVKRGRKGKVEPRMGVNGAKMGKAGGEIARFRDCGRGKAENIVLSVSSVGSVCFFGFLGILEAQSAQNAIKKSFLSANGADLLRFLGKIGTANGSRHPSGSGLAHDWTRIWWGQIGELSDFGAKMTFWARKQPTNRQNWGNGLKQAKIQIS